MPNLYETLLIVTPEADDEGVSAVIGDLRTTIESDGERCSRLVYGNAGSSPTW